MVFTVVTGVYCIIGQSATSKIILVLRCSHTHLILQAYLISPPALSIIMSEASAAPTNHPIRAHSEGDIPDQESPTYKSPGHAPLKHVASYTFGSKKFGGRSVKKQWKFAALKTKELPDPWVGLGFDKIKEEVATRHMYNPRSGKWKTDKITIKMQSEVRKARVVR